MRSLVNLRWFISKLSLLISATAMLETVQAAQFFCQSGDVTCLIAAINSANSVGGKHVINLEPRIYALQAIDNTIDVANGLPSIRRSIRIRAAADDPPTVIERDLNAMGFRIFHVSLGGELQLEGIVVQRGRGRGPGIFNRGTTSLQNSIITDSVGEEGAIHNVGTLNVFRVLSVITPGFTTVAEYTMTQVAQSLLNTARLPIT